MADGADAVDLGPAASHPEAAEVPVAEEIRRLDAVLDRLGDLGAPLSMDSWRPETQRHALGRGVAYVNDIRGFPDPSVYPDLARATATLIVMHSVTGGTRAGRDPVDPAGILERIAAFFDARLAALAAAGVARDRLVADPGMGLFLGGNPEPSVVVLRNLGRLRARLGVPLYVSVSRKGFLGALSGAPLGARGAATLAAELHAAAESVDYIRTHDVRALREALAVAEALRR